MNEAKIEERTEAFRRAIPAGSRFGGLADLFPYDVDVSEFQAPEEPTNVMPGATLVERCTTSAELAQLPPSVPPLPPEVKLQALRAGYRRALTEAGLETLIPWITENAEAYPLSPPRHRP